MSEAVTKAFAETKQQTTSGKSHGELNTAVFKYKGDLMDGQA